MGGGVVVHPLFLLNLKFSCLKRNAHRTFFFLKVGEAEAETEVKRCVGYNACGAFFEAG